MIKQFKELKRLADARSAERHNCRDGEGRVVLTMTLRDDGEFLSPFSDTANPVIGNGVADFIVGRAEAVSPKERLTLRVYGDCVDDAEKEIYRGAIGEYFMESHSANQREYLRNNVFALFLAAFGILVLTAMLLLENFGLGSVWSEVLDVIAWVFLWEAADLYFLQNRLLKIRLTRCLALAEMKIEYYPLAAENGGRKARLTNNNA